MRTISLKLPESLLVELNALARTRRTSKSELVRESLEQTLRSESGSRARSCYDLARDLAGSLNGLPQDIATNPKYLERFGE